MLIEGFESSEYKRHLQKSLDFIIHNGDINQGCPGIRNYASGVLKRIKDVDDDHNWSLKIGPWMLPVQEGDNALYERGACLVFNGEIDVENSEIKVFKFSVGILLSPYRHSNSPNCCCDRLEGNKYRIARLFRFEVEEGNVKTSKPYCHIHYGGQTQGEWHNCLEDWIEKPKIPFPPFDLVLILDLLIRQFDLGIPAKLFSEKNWSSCVKESERMILKGYYENINRHLLGGQAVTLLERLCTSP